jgi:multiple sugar transport system substrate-binding protein
MMSARALHGPISRRRLFGGMTLALGAAALAACAGPAATATPKPAAQGAPAAAPATKPSDASPTKPPDAAASAAAPKPTVAAAPKAGAAPITLIQWDFCEGPCDVVEPSIKQTIESFRKENPNVTIQLEMLNFDAGPQKFEVALRAGTPPDVYHWAHSPKDVGTGLLVDLKPWLTEEDTQDILKTPLDFMQYRGKVYHWATYTSVWCMAANKQMLEEAKVDWRKIQKQGWTTDEFVEIARSLTIPGKRWGYLWADRVTSTGSTAEQWSFMSRNFGVPYRMNGEGKWIFEGDGAVDSIQWLIDTYQKHKISPPETPGLKSTDAGDMYTRGEGAIFSRSGVWEISGRKRTNDQIDQGKVQGIKFESVLLPWPHHPKHPEVGWVSPFGIRAWRQKDYKGDAQTEAAAKYSRMRSIDESTFEPELIGVLPARKSADEKIVRAAKHPLLADAGAHYEFAQRYGGIGVLWWPKDLTPETSAKVPEIEQKAWGPTYQGVMAGQKTPKQGVDELRQMAEQILARP